MRGLWRKLSVKKKLALMDAARTAAADKEKLPELMALAQATFPDEPERLHKDLARYGKIHADFYDRDGHDAWVKDKN